MESQHEAHRDNPLGLLGCIATAAVLCAGLASFRTGNGLVQGKWMGNRVMAQGATVGALLLGSALAPARTTAAATAGKVRRM